MGLTPIDEVLLEGCLQGKARSWENFVDRFIGLVVHVVNHTAEVRGLRLSAEDRDDLVSEVFLNLLKNDFAILRHFRRQSSLATYLTVVARRIVVRTLLQSGGSAWRVESGGQPLLDERSDAAADPADRIADRDTVERLLDELQEDEARVVRMYHLEGRSYREISAAMGLPENSIGPILSRARAKMRHSRVNQAAG